MTTTPNYNKTLTFKATSRDIAQMRADIAANLVERVSDKAIMIIAEKLSKNPDWLANLAASPLLRTL